nr:methyl-accepting chemotaxis protein [Sphingomonas sp. GC_Shp_3]
MVALLGLIYALSARELTVRTDHILSHEAERLREVAAESLPEQIASEIRHNASGLTYFGLQARGGELIAGNLRVAGTFRFDHPANIAARAGEHGPLRVLAIEAPTGERILIARDIRPIVDLRHRILIILVASGLAIVALVLGAGFLLSLAPLRRVRDLQETSRRIAAGRLDLRMPVGRRGDELDLFAGTVNTMIEEVERVVAQVKDVTDAVAHDLRTTRACARQVATGRRTQRGRPGTGGARPFRDRRSRSGPGPLRSAVADLGTGGTWPPCRLRIRVARAAARRCARSVRTACRRCRRHPDAGRRRGCGDQRRPAIVVRGGKQPDRQCDQVYPFGRPRRPVAGGRSGDGRDRRS